MFPSFFQVVQVSENCSSTTAAETLALAYACDMALIVRHDLQRMLQRAIPILLLTDAQILFETLVSRRHTAERRLMIDLASLRECYEQKDVANIGLTASKDNIADAFTKLGANTALWNVLCSGRLAHPIQKWVLERDRRSRSISGAAAQRTANTNFLTSRRTCVPEVKPKTSIVFYATLCEMPPHAVKRLALVLLPSLPSNSLLATVRVGVRDIYINVRLSLPFTD
jgi:hypothetical protein